MRTDSPTDTSTRRLAGRNCLISALHIVVLGFLNLLEQLPVGNHMINDPVFYVQPARAMPTPCTRQRLIVKAPNRPQSGRARDGGDVLPLFVPFLNLQGRRVKLLTDSPMLLNAPHAT